MAERLAMLAERRAAVETTAPRPRRADLQPSRRPAPIDAIEQRDSVAVVRVAAPLSRCSAFEAATFRMALHDLAGRPGVEAIVLAGDTAFDAPEAEDPETAALIVAAAAECPRPVFAAVEGSAVGVGLELALACAGRVAAAGSQFALPAVLAGRLPLHGGVQRLQTLLGESAAARLIVFGETVDSATALRIGLIDGLVARGAAELAVALAHRGGGATARAPSTPLSRRSPEELPSIRYQIQRLAPGQAAPLAAVQAMEAAIQLPPRRAALEIQAIAARLAATDQAHALRHAAAAETARKHSARQAGETDAAQSMALAWPMRREAIHLLDEGASPAQVDRTLLRYGFSHAPFAEADRLGFAAVFSPDGEEVAKDRAWPVYSPTLDFMIDAGRAGGAQPGWFRGRRGEAGQVDPEVERIVVASALFRGVTRERPSDETLERRLVQAMIAGSIDLLLACPDLGWTDVDALWRAELGFPRWRGGPLYQGARRGWAQVCAEFESGACRRTLGPMDERLKAWVIGDGAPRLDA